MSIVTFIGSGSWTSGISYTITTTLSVASTSLLYVIAVGSMKPTQVSFPTSVLLGNNLTRSNGSTVYLSSWRTSGFSIPPGTVITLNVSGATNHTAAAFSITGYTATDASAQGTQFGTGTAVTITSGSPLLSNYEVMMFTVGWAGQSTDTLTPSGVFSPTYQTNVGNAFSLYVAPYIATTNAAETGSGTLSTSRAWASTLDVFECARPTPSFFGGGIMW